MAEDGVQVQNENPEGDNASNLEKALLKLNPKIFEGVKKEQRAQILQSFVITMSKTHIGPLPDPETFTAYANLIPNGADRIMQMAEKQLDHRISLETKTIGSQMTQSNIGQFLAFFLAAGFLYASYSCVMAGHSWLGAILGIGGLTGLVTAFIKGKSYQRTNLKEKRPVIKQKG